MNSVERCIICRLCEFVCPAFALRFHLAYKTAGRRGVFLPPKPISRGSSRFGLPAGPNPSRFRARREKRAARSWLRPFLRRVRGGGPRSGARVGAQNGRARGFRLQAFLRALTGKGRIREKKTPLLFSGTLLCRFRQHFSPNAD
jgi:ferredoxin